MASTCNYFRRQTDHRDCVTSNCSYFRRLTEHRRYVTSNCGYFRRLIDHRDYVTSMFISVKTTFVLPFLAPSAKSVDVRSGRHTSTEPSFYTSFRHTALILRKFVIVPRNRFHHSPQICPLHTLSELTSMYCFASCLTSHATGIFQLAKKAWQHVEVSIMLYHITFISVKVITVPSQSDSHSSLSNRVTGVKWVGGHMVVTLWEFFPLSLVCCIPFQLSLISHSGAEERFDVLKVEC